MEETTENLFEQGLERYRAGEAAADLLPIFKQVCDLEPKNGSAWSCLAWLYLLEEQPQKALKAAQKSVKIDPKLPQAHVNLVLSLLDNAQKGVRPHIELVQKAMELDEEIRSGIVENIEDGLARKPDWESLKRVQKWLISE
ncbi:MAG: hypothetical protein HC890_03060 [Chloroflexaceae bacterium]|nr:hypothetical protein [Chloroflexaceae bacterium]